MNEMINATTSLLPLLTVEDSPSLYYKASILSFCFIATINHILPENLEGTTHIVKLLVSNILFSLINIDPAIGVAISLIDLSPIFFRNKNLIKLGELFVQIPRLLIDLYLIIYRIMDIQGEQKYIYRGVFILTCKLIYYLERRLRIKRNERSNFYFFHCSEHIGLYVFLCSLVNCNMYNIALFFKIFICFIVFWCFLFYLINVYLYMNFYERVPSYIKKDDQMMAILSKKLEKNLFNGKLHNYICKPWTYHLKLEFVSWSKIEKVCQKIVDEINNKTLEEKNNNSIKRINNLSNDSINIIQDAKNESSINEIDYIVGIATGGVFVAACLGKILNKPVKIISSKLWSGITFYENYKKATDFFNGKEVKPDITGNLEIKGKKILLVDDTTYTGITIKNCIDYCLNVCGAQSVKTCIMWTYNRFIPNYYMCNKRVPIIWEWGVEVD